MINELYSKGIENIYTNDWESQIIYLAAIGEKLRSISVDTLKKAQAFYVPNQDYMKNYFGIEIVMSNAGCYLYNTDCVWHGYMVMPMYNAIEEIVGFVGFNPESYLRARETGDKANNPYYSYTVKSLMKKGNYLFSLRGEFPKSLNKGYTCLTDGLFDTLSLIDRGYHSHAILASIISEVAIAQLRFYKKVIFISDNDEAGVGTYKKLIKHLDNVVWLKQGYTKDVDALLNTIHADKLIKELDRAIEDSNQNVFTVDFKRPRIRKLNV